MSPEIFSDLLEKFLREDISGEELKQFLGAARDENNQLLIKDRLAQQFEQPFLYKVSDSQQLDTMFERMLAKAQQEDHQPAINTRRRTWPRYAAAAVVVLACGLGAWFYNTNPGKTTPAVTTVAARSVAPGREGAILTLADGKRIVLDSLANGIVASQNGTIISMDNGRINYHINPAGHNTPGIYNTISTPPGRQFQLVLSDGTRIWLNAASNIRFPTAFGAKERRVELSGEAYLEVAHNPKYPFRVMTRGAEVRVLGTVFNISAYDDESAIKATLLEGKISITARPATDRRTTGNDPEHVEGRPTILLPGQQVKINRTGEADPVNALQEEVQQAVAWKNGLFLMKGADVSVIMRQVARWYDIKVVFDGPVPEGKISGELPRNMDLQKLLEVIKASGIPISFNWEGNTLIVKN